MNLNKRILSQTNVKISLFILITYSIFCSLIIGNSWDLNSHLQQGKSTFNYLFSFGSINNDTYINLRQFNSASYWTFVYFISQFFPKHFELEIFKLINLLISWFALLGFYKLGKIIYNKFLGYLFFLTLFFYPTFFGHMAINPKDTILVFCHIWLLYLSFYYLKKQKNKNNLNHIIYKIGILLSIGTGIQLYFIASLLPIFLFIVIEIFFLKKIIKKDFNTKKFVIDLSLICIIFYFILILFWIDTHQNILIQPVKLFLESFSASRGWPVNILDGEIFYTKSTPYSYIFILLLNKTPEYILYLYLVFILFFFQIRNFYKKNIKNFNYFLLLFVLLIFFPNIILFLNPFGVYDGIRLFLWVIPYFLIIPSLTIYYLIKNFNQIKNKINSFFISFLIVYHLIIFLIYTPYQYTYLNFLTYETQDKEEKFENDYWGVTLKELIKKIKKEFKYTGEKKIKVFLCAVPGSIIKKNLKENQIYFFDFVESNQADFIILTNRVFIKDINNPKLEKCNDYLGDTIINIKKFNHILSSFGKIKN